MDAAQQVSAPVGVAKLRELRRHDVLLAVALAATLVLAVALRFYGIDWDRGHSSTPHPDERAILMKVAELSPPSPGQIGLLFDAAESPWNPRWFPYGSFPLYLLKGVQLSFSSLTGVELHDLRVAGRAISALADVGTVVLVFVLGSRMYGRREGLLASALVALAVMHIQLSHFYAVDTLLGLFTVAALYFLYRVATRGRLLDSVLAGVMIGLGLGTKVSQAPIYMSFFMAHLLFLLFADGAKPGGDLAQRLETALKGLGAGLAASVAVFIVVQPYAFLDWSTFLGDVVEQSEMVRRIRDYPYTRQYVDTTPYWYHVRQLATWGLGWPLGAVAWAGLLYAALRGMRPRHGMLYLALGLGLPAALLVYSTSFVAILAASAIAFVALVATLPFRSASSRGEVLLLSWVAPYFLITGAFDVKFMRYLIPISPILVLLGSRMMIDLWDRAQGRTAALRPWLIGGLLVLVGSTAAYAVSYVAIYKEPHTALRTSQWIRDNAPRGSTVLKEHWEEGIPNLHGYRVRELPLYNDDEPRKLQALAASLAGADYVWFYSNRLYGTIPRLPDRYPFSTEYYRLLFSGDLGYDLVDVETSYPRLAGLSLADNTFGRPGIHRPGGFDVLGHSGTTLNLGFADESFTVYDHPTGLVFQNTARHDAETIERTILNAVPEDALVGGEVRGRKVGLLLSEQDAAAQREGGTWSEIVRANSWTNRYPVLAWLLMIEVLGLVALPFTFVLFRPLADRGYLFSKALGLLAASVIVWLLASVQWMAFSRASIGLALLVLVAASTLVLARRWREMLEFVRRRWPLILIAEGLFLVAFLSFVMLRMANPDLWHFHRGGEKPMELAYLNAVLKSTYMPPYDPWFGGGYLNYYYYGQFMVAMLIKATGIDPRVAFNLAVPMFFSLTAAGAFTIVYNLAEGTRRALHRAFGGGELGRMRRASPVLAGVAGAVFVAVLGNLDGAVQVGQGVWRVMFRNLPFGQFDFWRSSRMMPPDPPGFEITEFPFFTFLFADLHPHMMAMPVTLLAIGLALAVVLAPGRARGRPLTAQSRERWRPSELVRLAALGVVVGALRPLNAWDFPTYMIVAAAAVFLASYFWNGGLNLLVVIESGVKVVFVFVVGYMVFRPYHVSYEAFFSSLWGTTNRTVLWQFLGIAGLFVFIVGSFLINESKDWLNPWWRALRRRASRPAGLPSADGTAIAAPDRSPVSRGRAVAMLAAAAVIGLLAAVLISGPLGSTIRCPVNEHRVRRKRVGMRVHDGLEPFEIRVDPAHARTPAVEQRIVALSAARRRRGFKSGRGSSRHLAPPRARLCDARQAVEIRQQIGHLAVADLRLDEGGHDPPRPANGACELRKRQVAAGQVGPEGARSAVSAVTITALYLGAFPQRLSRLGITGPHGGVCLTGSHGGARLAEREQKQDDEKDAYVHVKMPPLVELTPRKHAYVTSDPVPLKVRNVRYAVGEKSPASWARDCLTTLSTRAVPDERVFVRT